MNKQPLKTSGANVLSSRKKTQKNLRGGVIQLSPPLVRPRVKSLGEGRGGKVEEKKVLLSSNPLGRSEPHSFFLKKNYAKTASNRVFILPEVERSAVTDCHPVKTADISQCHRWILREMTV